MPSKHINLVSPSQFSDMGVSAVEGNACFIGFRLSRRGQFSSKHFMVLRYSCPEIQRTPKRRIFGHLLLLHPFAPQKRQSASFLGGHRAFEGATSVTCDNCCIKLSLATSEKLGTLWARGSGSCLFFFRTTCGAPPQLGVSDTVSMGRVGPGLKRVLAVEESIVSKSTRGLCPSSP